MEYKSNYNSESGDEQYENAARFVESAMGDPAMERVIHRAREWENFLQVNDVGFEKLTRIIKELDEQWKTWIGKEVSITGRIMNIQPNNEVTLEMVEDMVAISNGFYMMQHRRPNIDSDERITYHPVHQFLLPIQQSSETTESYRAVYAPVNDVTIQSTTPSQERALMWLETTSPDFLDEIDRRIQKTDSPEASLLSLRGLDVDIVADVRDPLTRQSAELYLEGMIPLDTQMPFGIYLDGHSYEILDGAPILLLHQKENKPGFIRGVKVIKGMNLNGKPQWEVATPVQLYDKDSSTKPIDMLIPVDSLVALHSMRRAFFERDGVNSDVK